MNERRIAIYVVFDKDGILDGFRKYYLQELRKVTEHILVIVNGKLTPESRLQLESGLCDDILVRENTGLLTYGWIEGLNHIGWDKLLEYDELLMLNDSFFGPFFPLSEMFEAMEKTDADFYGPLKNFEDKGLTDFFGHKFKHGHIRGTICYFYVIRSRLLHSNEFKKYWSEKPEIHNDYDTYFFNEIAFYDYVVDSGFKVDAYQTDKLKGVLFDNLTHNMYRLLSEDRIPFARIRPFATDMMDQSTQFSYTRDPRLTLEYIDKHTDYDVNLIWDYILRTKSLTDIYNQLQLQYVVPKNSLEKPYSYDKPIAVILHVYYADVIDKLADYCLNFPPNTDFYLTAVTEETADLLKEAFDKRGLKYTIKVRPNVGVAISSLWITYADVVTSGKYEYICYFHDKKSSYFAYSILGEEFAHRCYDSLFGTPEVVKNAINLFEENSRLGVLGPPMVYHGDYFLTVERGKQGNTEELGKLVKKLDLKVPFRPDQLAPSAFGDMLWFRSDALKKAIGYGFKYDDFDIKYEKDFTILHAIERIYGLAAQDAGYYYADIINSDTARTDLINYKYMLTNICLALMNRGIYPYSYISTIQQIQTGAGQIGAVQTSASRLFVQALLEKKKTHWLGVILVKTYHLFRRKKK